MNRERLLLVAVLAIIALWYFVLRTPVEPVTNAKPGMLKIARLAVKSADSTPRSVNVPDPMPFTLVTNEKPHKRPILPLTAPRDLPNIWPPTSSSVSLTQLGKLRRAATPQGAEDKATIQLPAVDKATGGDAGGARTPRVDQWNSFGRVNKGQVTGLRVKGNVLRAPKTFPKPGETPEFYRLLVLAELDPALATAAGVDGIEVKFAKGGTTTQNYPAEIDNVKVAVDGAHKGWFIGAREYLRLPKTSAGRRKDAGKKLLAQGKSLKDNEVLGWALFVLGEARAQLPAAEQSQLRDILLLELVAANLLNRQEKVLELGFAHLSRFPREAEVLEYMGNILSSRSYGLRELAVSCFARAPASRSAQRSRALLLIEMGRFAEAKELLDGGGAGAGVEVDLARARVALAEADYKTAEDRAGRHASGAGATAAEAQQILGGVAYAKGDAAAAERHFLDAITADNARSTAYSDLGLALAVQGKGADAQVCFDRATELDFENSVVPRLGAIFVKLALSDSAADGDLPEEAQRKQQALADALPLLAKLQEDNPRNLLVRYFHAYAKERSGDGEGAAADLRAVLDEDHRYRIAIARLGIVQARRREAGGPETLVRPAVAHLTKAAELNPQDATVAYILGRFLMSQDLNRADAQKYLIRTQGLPTPELDPNLSLWAQAALAALMYRDDGIEELNVQSKFNEVLRDVRTQGTRAGKEPNRYVDTHPVGRYATLCRAMVAENAKKVDVAWTFTTRPRDWDFHAKNPMQVIVTRGKGIQFKGQVSFQGKEVDHKTRLEYCAIEYKREKVLNGNAFYELIVEGELPGTMPVEFGLGIVGVGGSGRKGRAGLQVRRSTTGKLEMRLEGGSETEIFKRDKARNYIEFDKSDWPTGKFTLHIKVEDRAQGLVSVRLNGENVLASKLTDREGNPLNAIRCTIFGRGRGSRPVALVAWVEGTDGARFQDLYISKVTLVRARQ